MSMSRSIAGGRSALASIRRCCPILMATARAPTLDSIFPASESGTMPSGAASSTRRRCWPRTAGRSAGWSRNSRSKARRSSGGRSSRVELSAATACPTGQGVAGPRAAMLEGSAGRQLLTRIAALISAWSASALKPPRSILTGTVIPRMRLGYRPVKLPIANVPTSPWSGQAAFSPLKTPRKQIYSPQLRRFKERLPRQPPTLTKTGRSRISRANCPRWPGSTGGGSFGP